MQIGHIAKLLIANAGLAILQIQPKVKVLGASWVYRLSFGRLKVFNIVMGQNNAFWGQTMGFGGQTTSVGGQRRDSGGQTRAVGGLKKKDRR